MGETTGGNKIEMTCEHRWCKSTNVRDYKRRGKDITRGWEDEPIALCPKHAGDREPIIVNPFLDIPKNDSAN